METTFKNKEWIYVGMVAAIVLLLYVLVIRKKDAKAESSFGRGGGGGHHGGHHGGRHGGHHGRHHGHGGRGWYGGGGWLGWGYPDPYYYDVYSPIAVTTTDCPKGWVWMGAMLGCQKPQGI